MVKGSVSQIQANADSAARTMKVYTSCMEQIARYSGRKVHSTEILEEGDPRQDEIKPIEMKELLQFLETKRSTSGSLSKSTAQGFKAAVSKFRSRNGFPKFPASDTEYFKKYLCNNFTSSSSRNNGNVGGNKGKRRKKKEMESISLFDMSENYCSEICSKIDEMKSAIKTLQERQDSIQENQAKLKRLLSAAATSGMTCGEQQLEALGQRISASVVSAIAESPAAATQALIPTNAIVVASVFQWRDGTRREVPENFEVMKTGAKVVDVWRTWWSGYWDGEKRVKPYKILFRQFRQDINDAYVLRNENLNTCRRVMSEVSAVMRHLEAVCSASSDIREEYSILLQSCNGNKLPNEQLLASVWKKCWAKVLKGLTTAFDATAQRGKNRKHDLSKCTLRTVRRKLRL